MTLDLGTLRAKVDLNTSPLDKAASRAEKRTSKLASHMSTALAGIAVGALAKGLANATKEAANFVSIRDQFRVMGGNIDTLRSSVGGLQTDLEIMAARNKATVLGLSDDVFVAISRAARATAASTGEDMAQLIKAGTEGAAAGSKEALAKIGFDVEALGDKSRWATTILIEGNRAVEKMGGISDSTADRVDRLTSQFSNMQTELAARLIPTVEEYMPAMENLMVATVGAIDETSNVWGTLKQGWNDVVETIPAVETGFQAMLKILAPGVGLFERLAESVDSYAESLKALKVPDLATGKPTFTTRTLIAPPRRRPSRRGGASAPEAVAEVGDFTIEIDVGNVVVDWAGAPGVERSPGAPLLTTPAGASPIALAREERNRNRVGMGMSALGSAGIPTDPVSAVAGMVSKITDQLARLSADFQRTAGHLPGIGDAMGSAGKVMTDTILGLGSPMSFFGSAMGELANTVLGAADVSRLTAAQDAAAESIGRFAQPMIDAWEPLYGGAIKFSSLLERVTIRTGGLDLVIGGLFDGLKLAGSAILFLGSTSERVSHAFNHMGKAATSIALGMSETLEGALNSIGYMVETWSGGLFDVPTAAFDNSGLELALANWNARLSQSGGNIDEWNDMIAELMGLSADDAAALVDHASATDDATEAVRSFTESFENLPTGRRMRNTIWQNQAGAGVFDYGMTAPGMGL